MDKETPAAIAKIIKENTSPDIKAIPRPADHTGEIPVAIIPIGMEIKSIAPLFEEYREQPRRRKGTLKTTRLKSFVAATNRQKNSDSVIFAEGTINGKRISATLTAVLNYHPANGNNEDARHRDHCVTYNFPVSKEFAAWIAIDGEKMPQPLFAQLIEDRITDLVAVDGNYPGDDLAVLNPKFATPSAMLELSRGLEVHVNETVLNHSKLQSGEGKIQFSTEHKDASGQALNIPNFFMLHIPVFEMGKPYPIPVRLRYRIDNGLISFTCDLFRPDKVFDQAFNESCTEAQEHTDLPLYMGASE